MELPTVHKPATRLFYFWVGILATFSYRIIVVLNFYNPDWVLAAWYIGTVGFIIYFAHRYQVTQKRAKIIQERGLAEKVSRLNMDAGDQEAMRYVFNTLRSSKEKWNYIFIFTMSGLALIAGLIMDFIAPVGK